MPDALKTGFAIIGLISVLGMFALMLWLTIADYILKKQKREWWKE